MKQLKGAYGFTLIELLVVLLIISIILGLFVGGMGLFRDRQRKATSLSILQQVETALATASGVNGLSIAPVVHPLAGDAAGEIAAGWEVTASQWVTDSAGVERFVGAETEGDLPHFFGLARRHLTLLSPSAPWIIAGARPMELGATYEAASRVLLAQVLSSQMDSLNSLKAIRESAAPDTSAWHMENVGNGDTAYSVLIDPISPEIGAWDANHRIWYPPEQGDQSLWSPGRYRTDDGWRAYRTRGLSIVDGWGNEVLIARGGDGLVALSPGSDGCFVVHPGPDRLLDTTRSALATVGHGGVLVPGGDDLAADADNLPRYLPGE